MSTRFINVKSFEFGGEAYTTIESVTINRKGKMLKDSGDDDAGTSFMAKGPAETDITIKLKDPKQAAQLEAAPAGTLTYNGVPEDGGTELKVTVENAAFVVHDQDAKHGAIHTQSVNGSAYMTDGSNPVTYEDA